MGLMYKAIDWGARIYACSGVQTPAASEIKKARRAADAATQKRIAAT
jgi:hypothetical protein